MWIFAIPLLIVMVVLAIIGGYESGGEAEIQVAVATEVALYRTFVSTADLHFRNTPAPSVKTSYRWSDIRVSAAPAVSGAGMPPSWLAVRRADGTWAACTELSEGAIAAVGSLYPPVEGEQSSRLIDFGMARAVVLGTEADALVAGDLCKGA